MKIVLLLTALVLCIVINLLLRCLLGHLKDTLQKMESIRFFEFEIKESGTEVPTPVVDVEEEELDSEEELEERKLESQERTMFMNVLDELKIGDQVYLCNENYRHTNTVTPDYIDAYLYVIAETEKKVLLVYESTNENTASYIIWIRKWHKYATIRRILKFFESEEINKRSSMNRPNYLVSKIPCVLKSDVKVHQNFEDWNWWIMHCRNEL